MHSQNIICGGRGESTRAKAWRDKHMDDKLREECQSLGIFEQVWPGQMQRLPEYLRTALLTPTDGDIATMRRRNLEIWLKQVPATCLTNTFNLLDPLG